MSAPSGDELIRIYGSFSTTPETLRRERRELQGLRAEFLNALADNVTEAGDLFLAGELRALARRVGPAAA